MVSMPRLVIAGTHSGVGKTTVAVGLMAALRRRGVAVQPFKVGPDYIDPSHHTRAAGRVSRNLDTWLLDARCVRWVFQQASAGAALAVIEGVMGLFDGHSSTSGRGSTAEVAALLETPVVLVVDASRMARSAAALVRGFLAFDRRVKIAGVIFNRVSERHFRLLEAALRRETSVPALGYLPDDPGLAIPERHLGLIPAQEDPRLARAAERLGEAIRRTVSVERLARIATSAQPLAQAPSPWRRRRVSGAPVRIGLAKDEAFHFYYQENLDLLKALGAELVAFSPLRDAHLPERLDGLYLGGGFPEVHAAGLESNESLRREINGAVRAGVPTYAECGGLMYLAERLVDGDGHARAMVGALPGTIRMADRLQHFGYLTVVARRRSILALAGDRIKGHEFHYSVWDRRVPSREAAYTVVRKGADRRLEGFARANVLASYVHVHFLSNTRWADGLVASARRWREQ